MLTDRYDICGADGAPRAKATPKNPYGVAEGQIWDQTDYRPWQGRQGYYVRVLGVNLRKGVAYVTTPEITPGHKPRQVRLDRFCPKHHYRLDERF